MFVMKRKCVVYFLSNLGDTPDKEKKERKIQQTSKFNFIVKLQ